MNEELQMDNLGLAPGVLETIVTIAAKGVDGVAAVGSSTLDGLARIVPSLTTPNAVGAAMSDDGLEISVHLDVVSGRSVPAIAADVRQAVFDAVTSQVGFAVACVDVYVDGIRFAE